MKKFFRSVIPSIIGSGLTIAVFVIFGFHTKETHIYAHNQEPVPVKNAVYTVNENGAYVPLDFTGVSQEVMNSVVHISSIHKVRSMPNSFYNDRQNPLGEMFGDDFFRFFREMPDNQGNQGYRGNQGRQPEELVQKGTGSGVIVSSNGYIVTNNHVVDGADDIEVTLHNNETYKAKVIGTDPSTDIALIQIRENNLQGLPFGNSDQVEVGEWVMAIGNPFNLNSTVTAGIISAKGRNINIIDDKSAIEAFIQTDAAINPGNSGGALVNLKGELVGINTAIASSTGVYAGYGFAIPANIVNKVVDDLMKYGMVQRAYLGIMIRDINSQLMKDRKLKRSEGCYVDSLMENSSAAEAGIMPDDIITAIDDAPVLKSSDVLEQIGRHRPGDEVAITVDRHGKEMSFRVSLADQKGRKKLVPKEEMDIMDVLGASFEKVDRDVADQLGIKGGVRVKELNSGLLKNQTDITEGFIITGINHEKVKTVDDIRKVLKQNKGGILIEGIYEDYPGTLYFALGIPK